MNRTVKLVLPPALFLLACLVGLAQAQQGPTAPAPGKEQGKAREAENEQLIQIQPKEQQQKALLEERLIKERAEVFKKWENQLEDLKCRKSDLRSRQMQMRDEIEKQCGMSPENVVPCLLNIEREIFTAQIDLETKERSKDMLAKQIAENTEIAKKNIDNDSVLKNLQSLVNDKSESLILLERLFQSGTAPYSDFNKAKAELTEAKIRLALREEELTKGNAEAGMAKFNLILRENSLAAAQLEARFIALSKKCGMLRKARSLADQYTDLTESEIPRLNRQIDRLSEKILDEKAW